MTTYLNGTTRSGGSDVVVVPTPSSSGAPGIPDAPFDDGAYLRQNGLWVPADFAAPEHAHSVSSFVVWQEGATASGASINNGSSWNSKESPWAISVPGAGHVLVLGSCWLQHNVSSGDPECRVTLAGPVSGVSIHTGKIGTGSVGGIQVQVSVTTMARAIVTGAGTVEVQRQVRNNSSSGTGHEWGNFDLICLFTPATAT